MTVAPAMARRGALGVWLCGVFAMSAVAAAAEPIPVVSLELASGVADRPLPIGRPFALVVLAPRAMHAARVTLQPRSAAGCEKLPPGDVSEAAIVLDWTNAALDPVDTLRVFVPALHPEPAWCVTVDAQTPLSAAERTRLAAEFAQLLGSRVLVLANAGVTAEAELVKATLESLGDLERRNATLTGAGARRLSQEPALVRRVLNAIGQLAEAMRRVALEKGTRGGRASGDASVSDGFVDAWLAFRGPWRSVVTSAPAALSDLVRDIACIERTLVPSAGDVTREVVKSRIDRFRRASCDARPDLDRERLVAVLVALPGALAALTPESRALVEGFARALAERAAAWYALGDASTAPVATNPGRDAVLAAVRDYAGTLMASVGVPASLGSRPISPTPLLSWRFSTDLGLAVITGDDDRTTARAAWIGLHVHPFGWIDSSVSVRAYPNWVVRNLSVFVGLVPGAPSRDASPALESVFAGISPLGGVSLRVFDYLRVSTGAAFYRAPDRNPLVAETSLKARWFLGASVDLNVLQWIEKSIRGDAP